MRRIKTICLGVVVMMTFASTSSARTTIAEKGRNSAAFVVPFVGCPSDGQLGPKPAPKGKPHPVVLPHVAAKRLAYYATEEIGVLAPRDWHGSGKYGSNGATLTVVPSSTKITDSNVIGPVVEVEIMDGQTSGRFSVASVISRFFPHYKRFVDDVVNEGIMPKNEIIGKPYPNDKLTYVNDHVVEFTSPANSDGFGISKSNLQKDSAPICGTVILETAGKNSLDVQQAIILRVRLEPKDNDLASRIVHQFERDQNASQR